MNTVGIDAVRSYATNVQEVTSSTLHNASAKVLDVVADSDNQVVVVTRYHSPKAYLLSAALTESLALKAAAADAFKRDFQAARPFLHAALDAGVAANDVLDLVFQNTDLGYSVNFARLGHLMMGVEKSQSEGERSTTTTQSPVLSLGEINHPATPSDGSMLAEVKGRREDICLVAARFGVSNVRVFGSAARGDAGSTSDLDLLVDFDAERHGLGPLASFRAEVSALLGRPVDVAILDLLRDDVRIEVEEQAIPL